MREHDAAKHGRPCPECRSQSAHRQAAERNEQDASDAYFIVAPPGGSQVALLRNIRHVRGVRQSGYSCNIPR